MPKKKASTALTWIIKEAKRIKKQNPRRFKKWTDYVSQASAIYASKHKGKSPVGKKKSVGAAKKKFRQTGSSNKFYDQMHKAKPPGTRIVKHKKGKNTKYTERRKNRSDMPGKLTGATTGSGDYNQMVMRYMKDANDKLIMAERDLIRFKNHHKTLSNGFAKTLNKQNIVKQKKLIGSLKQEIRMQKALLR